MDLLPFDAKAAVALAIAVLAVGYPLVFGIIALIGRRRLR